MEHKDALYLLFDDLRRDMPSPTLEDARARWLAAMRELLAQMTPERAWACHVLLADDDARRQQQPITQTYAQLTKELELAP